MNYLIKNITLVNEGNTIAADIYIKNGRIEKISSNISVKEHATEIDGMGLHAMPGIIDDQVHFREPGLTQKGDLHTESKAAVAGGVTTFMDMPNVNPPSLTQQLLEERYLLAATKSLANYSFYMGVSNDNAEEVLKTKEENCCGIKIFMGASTGNMLVDDDNILIKIFKNSPLLIATHCEHEATVKSNLAQYIQKYGDNIPIECHPLIRNEESCFKSSSHAVELAQRFGTRLHVLHISTQDELILFNNTVPLKDKRITAEVCTHHLFFDADDYKSLGTKIKWNPAIKDKHHKQALFEAMLNNTLDVIATDHAPHTVEEKNRPYTTCPSGAPMVQHSLNVMLSFFNEGKITLEKIVEKMCHAPAICFNIQDRGFLCEGYFADLFLVDLKQTYKVSKENILYKCGWSPLEEKIMHGKVTHTFVSGHLAFHQGVFDESKQGSRVLFNRR